MEARLQKRYLQLVESHMNVVQAVAAGIKSLPGTGQSFAATQGAWRFFANPRVTLPKLIEPIRELGRQACEASASPYALIALDWSKLDYDGHASKTDLTQLSQKLDQGYELTTALLVDADDGSPLAPMGMSVLSAEGHHSTQAEKPPKRKAHLEQVLPWMKASRSWGLSKPPVFVIDREGDSIKHLRGWDEAGHRFLVRADDRRTTYRGKSMLFTEIIKLLEHEKTFQYHREVTLRGRSGQLWVAETELVLDGPAWGRTVENKNQRIPGKPLSVRLVATQVRDAQGKNLAEWKLLSNVKDVSDEQLATWYYWRWQIESWHKLLKSAGLEVEEWLQESASAIAKRLLVGAMACVTVWLLQRQTTPVAVECQQFLVRVSGRQTKRSRPITTPALLAGLHLLLNMLQVLEHYTPTQLRQYALTAAPILFQSG